MRSYGQFCPVAKAAEIFCERWNALIIRDLAYGPRRFSELRKGVPLMSPSLLSQRLKFLIAEDIVSHIGQGRGSTYTLTESGREFVPLVEALGIWGQRWTRRELQAHEIDLGLFVWSVEDSAKPEGLGRSQSLIQWELTDQPPAKQLWWFQNKEGKCKLCVDHPGGDVDLYLSSTLPDAIRVIRGDIALPTAVATGRLEAIGEKWARDNLANWLNLSQLAQIPSQRIATAPS